MSWSASYPVPTRRSRSRSPPRPPYPSRAPYPDGGYPPESYRGGHYEAADRERPHGYERERPPNDYGRRGRSRSPGPDDFTRKRRRSLSPYERDRYDPRPRYNDDYDAHSRGYGYSPPRRRAPPDPHTFDYPASLKQYAEWFRYFYPQQAIEEDNADKAAEQEAGDGSKPRNGIKSKWEKYKKDFAATQLQTMFDHHRKSPWFAEKYDPAPEFERLRTRVRKEGWKGRLGSFLHDLESGKFDPDLNEAESEPTSPVKETHGTNGESSNDVNGTSAPVEEPKVSQGDDDMQFNMDAEEDPGENDAPRTDTNGKSNSIDRRNNRGEEISVPPEGNQVMIRTIPPDIGRVKLEDALSQIPGFVYMALGDPLQKRNYYRAAFLRFEDDADMTAVMAELSDKKIEGFKLHVSHSTRPFVNRIRYAPEVASKPDRLAKDLGNAKILANLLESEAAKLRKTKIQQDAPIPETEGSAPEADVDVTMTAPEGEDGDEEELAERGIDAVERRIEKVMADMRDQGLVDLSDEKAYETQKTTVALDLYLAYLRAAFNTCYYCCVTTDHLEELQRKCLKHVRKPLSKSALEEIKAAEAEKAEKERKMQEDSENPLVVEKEVKRDNKDRTRFPDRNDERWIEGLDSKIALMINRDGVDPRDYGGKHYDDELTKAVEPFIKKEEEGKFRCKTCLKLFKATSFVEKHIANKHPENVRSLEEFPYFNNFALDPQRIQPFAHPPPVVGNSSQAPPPQAYGIQGPPHYANYHDQRYDPRHGGGNQYGFYPPPPPANGHWGGGGAEFNAGGGNYFRRDEATTARRLSDRISGFAPGSEMSIPAAAGLPPRPTPAALDTALVSGNNRRGGRGPGAQALGPPPPPPPDAREDPRAAAGRRVSYHDMDLVAEGDVELSY